jgi:signal transduction histidine kinase
MDGIEPEARVVEERLSAVSELARGVGHDLGNLLLRVMGKAELALLETEPARVREQLEAVLAATEKAGVIVRELQACAPGRPELRVSDVGVSLEAALGSLGPTAARTGARFERGPIGRVYALFDARVLEQIFSGVLAAAIDAVVEKGSLQLELAERADEEGRWAELRLSFDRRAGSRFSPGGVARGLLRALGGRIQVTETQAPRVGAVLRIPAGKPGVP